MKKLIKSLSAIGLVVTTSTVVISCEKTIPASLVSLGNPSTLNQIDIGQKTSLPIAINNSIEGSTLKVVSSDPKVLTAEVVENEISIEGIGIGDAFITVSYENALDIKIKIKVVAFEKKDLSKIILDLGKPSEETPSKEDIIKALNARIDEKLTEEDDITIEITAKSSTNYAYFTIKAKEKSQFVTGELRNEIKEVDANEPNESGGSTKKSEAPNQSENNE
ncbi:hypothetical protein EELLY_v1c04280 [Entomoplasma ellychniae]|uniref:Uncharacterized protein n=1 Tax=Entomoplasma ellychniae TaxID=2114 RepID=A0A8E2QYX1_9MOLU|nr:hypothetical protein [Entomoplasma ellychniae]PPE04748.1 hypothetical protein EELLY_v1c04280 [Entomoplasma ellychniae]